MVIKSNPSQEENSNLPLHSCYSSAPIENQHDFAGTPSCRKLARLNQFTHTKNNNKTIPEKGA